MYCLRALHCELGGLQSDEANIDLLRDVHYPYIKEDLTSENISLRVEVKVEASGLGIRIFSKVRDSGMYLP